MTASFVCQIVIKFMVALVFHVNVQRYVFIAERARFNNEDNIPHLGVVLGTETIRMSSARGSVAHFYKPEILDRVQ
jgi:hypothetical protein